MSATSLRAVIRHLQRTLASEGVGGIADEQLLQRFHRDRDEAAFETILWRHGPMVLNVCRRILRREADVEDAFQATFLALVRGAGSIRSREAIAAWLYRVAYRVAIKIEGQRRQHAREECVNLDQFIASDSVQVGTDVRDVIDKEIHRLPAKYQIPVVMCYLEGKTTTEAAQLLGWPRGTVGTRLAWARERLRIRLAKRGLAQTAFVGIGQPAMAIGMRELVNTTLGTLTNAGGGSVPATLTKITMLAHGVLRDMLVVKIKAAVVAALSVVVVLAGAGVVIHRSLVAEEKQPHTESERMIATPASTAQVAIMPLPGDYADPLDETTSPISVTGGVVDAEGKPVADAAVYLREQPLGRSSVRWLPAKTLGIAESTTDQRGRFEFKELTPPAPRLFRRQTFPLDLFVVAKGKAVAWKHLMGPEQRPIRLTLAPTGTIKGTLVRLDGKPAAGARVRVREIAPCDEVMRPAFSGPGFLDLTWAGSPLGTTTNEKGGFVLEGVPRNTRFTLCVDDPRYSQQDIYATNVDNPVAPLTEHARHNYDPDAGPHTVHPSGFTATVQPSARVRAQVVFDDTGKPAVGATWAEPEFSAPPTRSVDENARFVLQQLKPGEHKIYVYPPPKSDYLGTAAPIQVPASDAEMEPVVRLPRGEIITGEVLDADTGKGVADVEVKYVPHPDNRSFDVFGWQDVTGPDGKFRLVVPRGKSRVLVAIVPYGYLSHGISSSGSLNDISDDYLKPVEVAKGGQPVRLRFTLGRGATAPIQIIGSDGKPVSDAIVHMVRRKGSGSMRLPNQKANASGEFTLSGFRSDEEIDVLVTDAQKRQAAQFTHHPEGENKKGLLTEVELRPLTTAKGRVVSENGEPLAGVSVTLYKWVSRSGSPSRVVTTNANGEYSFGKLVPSIEYAFQFNAEGYSMSLTPRFTAEPGKVHAEKEVTLIKTDQILAGKIYNPNGKPWVGVAVSAVWDTPPDNPQTRASTPPRLTDSQGRFKLEGLPKGLIDVRVNISGDVRTHDFRRIKSGDQNVEIELDGRFQGNDG